MMITFREDGSIADEPVEPEQARFYAGWRPVTNPSGGDPAESTNLARRIRAQPKQCWFNARGAVLKLEEFAHASYVRPHFPFAAAG